MIINPYKLPIASSTRLGGIKAEEKTINETQEIKIDSSTGKLYAPESLVSETDPVFIASPSYGIASGDITNWNSAYSWGDHSTEGYLTSSSLTGYATETYVNTLIGDINTILDNINGEVI